MPETRARYDTASRFVAATLCIFIFALACRTSARAQTPDRCEQAVTVADAHYVEGRFDDVIATLSECMQRDGFVTGAVAAYRLMALAYLRKGEVEEARFAVVQLLSRQPNYEPDPVRDIPTYVALVNLVKQSLQPAAPPPPSEQETVASDGQEGRRSWLRSNRGWLIAGGSAVVAGVVTALLLGEGGDADSATLPHPPALPD